MPLITLRKYVRVWLTSDSDSSVEREFKLLKSKYDKRIFPKGWHLGTFEELTRTEQFDYSFHGQSRRRER